MQFFVSLVLFGFAVMLGMSNFPLSWANGLLAGTVAVLVLQVAVLVRQVVDLRQRVTVLERRRQIQPSTTPGQQAAEQEASAATTAAAEFPVDPEIRAADDAAPPSPEPTSPQPPPFTPEPLPPQPEVTADDWLALRLRQLLAWVTGGNPVLKIGSVVLFFGVAFLLKYAAQRELIPLALRLALVAAGGLGLLAGGFFLHRRHRGYGLGLEGTGVGVLYLVVFAAAKLYGLVPFAWALPLMIGLVGLSCALAILQDARALAVSGSIGGFLAPILLATGGGSHVQLFSYYALLNAGILAIAWFKAWRELHLLGFVCTFAIGTLWGASAYSPAHFATTEPFLLLFFVMYCGISVLFAHRQPVHLRGYIDGTLVFGLPIVASGLQAYLVHDLRYGLALSALALGFWYIGLARLLWQRQIEGMRLLTEAFLALGVVFASLAIPLGLDPHWTTAAWALEGAAMVWIGARQQRLLARCFGLLLQFGAGVHLATFWSVPPDGLPFCDPVFFGSALIAAGGLFSAYWLEHNPRARTWEAPLPRLMLAWALLWWYGGGIAELGHHVARANFTAALLLYTAGTTACLALLAHFLTWRLLVLGQLLLLPIMVFSVCPRLFTGFPSLWLANLLAGFQWWPWPLALGVQYAVLRRFEEDIPAQWLPGYHVATLWLVLLVTTLTCAHGVLLNFELAGVWSLACWGLIPTLLLFALEYWGARLSWPVVRFAELYHGIGTSGPVYALLLWTFLSLSASGTPAPLPYIPVLNPLELIELAILVLAGWRLLRRTGTASPKRDLLRPSLPVVLVGFCWLNAVVARSVHAFADLPYRFDFLFASPILQAAIACLWATLALSLTVWGARHEQRRIWLAGAGLLSLVVLKLFVVDLAGTGAIGRIVSFLVVGLLMLVIGFFAPLPPRPKEPHS